MVIAAHPVSSNAAHAAHFPASWMTLYDPSPPSFTTRKAWPCDAHLWIAPLWLKTSSNFDECTSGRSESLGALDPVKRLPR